MWLSNRSSIKTEEYNLVVSWKNGDGTFKKVLEHIEMMSNELRLIRMNKGAIESNIVLLISPKNHASLEGISEELTKINSNIEISIFESKTNW